MDSLDLSAFFITKAQSIDFSSRLSSVVEKIYQTNFNFEDTFAKEFGMQKKDIFMSLLRANNITLQSQASIKTFLEKILTTISSLSVVSLSLAFEPSDQTLIAISQWFVMNMNKQFLLDITIERKLIAGATVNCNGKHADFSIRPLFENILKEMLSPPHATPAQQITQPSNDQKEGHVVGVT